MKRQNAIEVAVREWLVMNEFVVAIAKYKGGEVWRMTNLETDNAMKGLAAYVEGKLDSAEPKVAP